MTFFRIKRPTNLLDVWSAFSRGLHELQYTAREEFNQEEWFKRICDVCADAEKGFVGVVYNDEGEVVCFGVAEDSTPKFAKERRFEVLLMWYSVDCKESQFILMGAFENFCRDSGIKSYVYTTKRNTGATIRCFRAPKYGFNKPYLTFEKEIKS